MTIFDSIETAREWLKANITSDGLCTVIFYSLGTIMHATYKMRACDGQLFLKKISV